MIHYDAKELEKHVRDWFEEVLPKFIAYADRHPDEFAGRSDISAVMDFVEFADGTSERFDEDEETVTP